MQSVLSVPKRIATRTIFSSIFDHNFRGPGGARGRGLTKTSVSAVYLLGERALDVAELDPVDVLAPSGRKTIVDFGSDDKSVGLAGIGSLGGEVPLRIDASTSDGVGHIVVLA